MEKQLIEILANAPDVSTVGIAYIEFLKVQLYFKMGVTSLVFIIIGIVAYCMIKSSDW